MHPFFREVFGGAGLDVVLAADKRPMEPTPWNLLTAIGADDARPGPVRQLRRTSSARPSCCSCRRWLLYRPPRRLWAIVGVGYAFLTLCLTQRQSMRFVLPCVGPMAVGVAWLAMRWRDRPRPGVPAAAGDRWRWSLAFESAIAIAGPGTGSAWRSGGNRTSIPRPPRADLPGRPLDRRRTCPPSARIIGQDHRGFYIPRPYAMEKAHRRRTGLGTRGRVARGDRRSPP